MLQVLEVRKRIDFWRSTTKLTRLVDTYVQNFIDRSNVKGFSSLKEEERVLYDVYLLSPDMQMLLNLLTEKEGIWSAILILSLFDKSFKNEFKVLNNLI